MQRAPESINQVSVSDGLSGYSKAGYSTDQIATMLYKAAIFMYKDAREKALRFHAIDLLTRGNEDFASFRSVVNLSRMISSSMELARMSKDDLNDSEVSPLLLFVGARLTYISPANAAGMIAAREDVHAAVHTVLDPRA